ncbi:MAG: penicillin acylase family protein, partial [Bacteroidota bacterium]
MTRLVLTAGVVLTAVVVLAAAVGVLAYGTEPTRTGTLSIEGLSEDVTLAWDDSGRVWVEGPAEVALATGLGYAHAVDHGWPASLWRRAATGTLAEWFGEEARALDIHARTLGFRALARRTYETLDAERRQVLDAYARGATAGFSEPGVVQSNPFIVVGAVPDAWQPWDALAIERLHIYLSAPALASDTSWQRAAATDSVVSEFVAADSSFRAFLGATGGGFDRAYTTDADTVSGQATLVHQVSAGSSALPHLAPAVLRSPAGVATALTIPGTLASPSGWSGGIAWALLSGSRLEIERYGGTRPPPVFSRIVERDGDETLLEVARDTSGLVLRAGAAPGAAPDTTASASGWRVRWRGFRVGTDLPAFSALRSGQP